MVPTASGSISRRPPDASFTRLAQSSKIFWFTEPACHKDCIFHLWVCWAAAMAGPAATAAAAVRPAPTFPNSRRSIMAPSCVCQRPRMVLN